MMVLAILAYITFGLITIGWAFTIVIDIVQKIKSRKEEKNEQKMMEDEK